MTPSLLAKAIRELCVQPFTTHFFSLVLVYNVESKQSLPPLPLHSRHPFIIPDPMAMRKHVGFLLLIVDAKHDLPEV